MKTTDMFYQNSSEGIDVSALLIAWLSVLISIFFIILSLNSLLSVVKKENPSDKGE